jgi:hypothetical protein
MKPSGPFGVRGLRPGPLRSGVVAQEVLDLVELQGARPELPRPGPPTPAPPPPEYDPIVAMYRHESVAYAPSLPWFAESPLATPQPPPATAAQPEPTAEVEPQPVGYESAGLDGAMIAKLMASVGVALGANACAPPAIAANEGSLEQMMLEYAEAVEVAACGAGVEMLEVAQAIAEFQMMQASTDQPMGHDDLYQMMQAMYDIQSQMLMSQGTPPGPGPI